MTFDYLKKAKRSEKNEEQKSIPKLRSNWTKFQETFVLLENLMKIQSDYSLWMNFENFSKDDKSTRKSLRYDRSFYTVKREIAGEHIHRVVVNDLQIWWAGEQERAQRDGGIEGLSTRFKISINGVERRNHVVDKKRQPKIDVETLTMTVINVCGQ